MFAGNTCDLSRKVSHNFSVCLSPRSGWQTTCVVCKTQQEDKYVLQEFKTFINKGDIVVLAVAVIMATAFKPIIDALVNGVIMQIIAAIFGKPNFDTLNFEISGTPIWYGQVITTAISFVFVALAVFFVLKAYNASKTKEEADDTPAGPSEIDLLTEIRDHLAK
jgi:large conductance mechanosensitive channel